MFSCLYAGRRSSKIHNRAPGQSYFEYSLEHFLYRRRRTRGKRLQNNQKHPLSGRRPCEIRWPQSRENPDKLSFRPPEQKTNF